MISDVLSDASADIKEYLVELPSVYPPNSGHVALINRALAAMDEARIALDTPPCNLIS